MNYEELYGELQSHEKRLKDTVNSLQKLYKAIVRDTESGDLKNLSRNLSAFSDLLGEQTHLTEEIKKSVEGFDSKTYYENGEFAEQLLEQCREKGVDVKGEYPVYEMFPYKVRLDAENQDIYLDRKRFSCVRPQSFVQMVKTGQDRLTKANFNSQAFLNELSDAYDMAVLKLHKQPESDIYLTSLYKFLVPMGRFRKDYDQQSYAFDLARLYGADLETTKSGRYFQFGPSRFPNKAIRILDASGNEQFLSTIRFYTKEEEDDIQE